MTKHDVRGAGVSPTRHGALLSAVLALVVALSVGLYAGVAADHGPGHRTNNALAAPATAAPVSTGVWVGGWATSPVGGEPGTDTTGMAGRTVRNVVHTSVGGTSARVTLSNLYGTRPLTLTHATLAVAAGEDGPAAATGTLRRLTFAGATTVTVPPGAQTVSDAVSVTVPRDSDILVSTYSPTSSGPVTYHPHARQTSYVADGEYTEDETGTAYTGTTPYWRYLTALDVLSDEADGTVVALGDSITDGVTSTPDANRRWPDVLADRLHTAARSGGDAPHYGVVNEGISGNQVLADDARRGASGLNRFERDVLDRTNVKVVVIDLGVNDILRNPRLADPEAVVGGLRTLVARAHAHGIKVIGATLMPFHGHRGYTDAREDVRQRINEAIRGDGVFDTVADFDKALRDPYDPRSLLPDYDSGDHLHPSDSGYREMAETINLEKLGGSTRPAQA
ncbi:GDSL-type esterase/lipase family protein [Streptomyces sp. NPDC049687]|uniref:GDSL-type esterase/lipase family protein n=1 Tax=Streptomyces sp. NPDC049687 TaxID=3365596 RepID=UPI003789C348